ncbi:hypothetical protein D7X30_00465 [Corallococcus sp. AB011P]|uniref:hypothetical protein n=1 Tax=unclassified Corallococcus TaxID=2685029 RepID=UPI000EB9ADE0|nr:MULTISPECIES: hypothetical protein [unclassified Corallococcus]RKG61854.1 hypothetical protein D7X30_00465 [Corallococcus sp. AB011P]RKH88046.1 hypothetical protein D7Y21_16475 [Corallococcus sp. AB045]
MNMKWEMAIENVFRFADGQVVFVGRIQKGPRFISPCVCELWQGTERVKRLRLEGEMLPETHARKDLRSVSTRESVDVEAAAFAEGGWRLIHAGEVQE